MIGVTVWLVLPCYCNLFLCDNCIHVECQATTTPSCTNGVMPVCGRPWYPPVSMPALIWINQSFNPSAESCLLAVPWAPGALYGSRSTYKVAQCMNIYHDKCCHPLDKKSPVPVNHGRPSKSNIDDKLWCPMWGHVGDLKDNSNKPSEDVCLIDTLRPESRLHNWTQLRPRTPAGSTQNMSVKWFRGTGSLMPLEAELTVVVDFIVKRHIQDL